MKYSKFTEKFQLRKSQKMPLNQCFQNFKPQKEKLMTNCVNMRIKKTLNREEKCIKFNNYRKNKKMTIFLRHSSLKQDFLAFDVVGSEK